MAGQWLYQFTCCNKST